MEKENVVSIWVGNFQSEEEFNVFLQEEFDEEGDSLPSVFMKVFEIDYIDIDFQEAVFQENLSKDVLLQASYADTFADKVDNLSGNSIILLYDFCYTGKVRETKEIRFLGTFEYRKQ